MERTDQPSALCMIIDANPREWASRPHAELAALLDQLLIFANGFHLLSASNRLVVLCVHPTTVRFAWPPSTARGTDAAAPVQPRALRSAVDQVVQQLLALPVPEDDAPESPLAAALALALCRLQRLRRDQPKVQPRIMVAHASPDVPGHHLACMNCVFAAQKQVTLDQPAPAPKPAPEPEPKPEPAPKPGRPHRRVGPRAARLAAAAAGGGADGRQLPPARRAGAEL